MCIVMGSGYGEPLDRLEVDAYIAAQAPWACISGDLDGVTPAEVGVGVHSAHYDPRVAVEERGDPLDWDLDLLGPYGSGMAPGLCIGMQGPVQHVHERSPGVEN